MAAIHPREKLIIYIVGLVLIVLVIIAVFLTTY